MIEIKITTESVSEMHTELAKLLHGPNFQVTAIAPDVNVISREANVKHTDVVSEQEEPVQEEPTQEETTTQEVATPEPVVEKPKRRSRAKKEVEAPKEAEVAETKEEEEEETAMHDPEPATAPAEEPAKEEAPAEEAPAEEPAKEEAPAEAPTKGVTLQQIRSTISLMINGANAASGKEFLRDLMKDFKLASIPALKEDQFDAFYAKLQEFNA